MINQDTLERFPEIQTSRLRLKGLDLGDAEDLQKMTDDPRITEIVHFLPTPFTVHDSQKLIVGNRDGRDRYIGVWFHDCDDMIAVVGTHLHGVGEIEVGYWVRPDQQRKGIAQESVSNLLDQLAELFPHRQIIAECRPENLPSRHLLEKMGFVGTNELGQRPGRYRFIWMPQKNEE
ncbi:GNAT family N-acetyltransferase [Asaia lannensis]|uniref:GNAT family N-acetyltransferase n=1 Tax=Asaia lannensis NBRC 102526 TaxID=1307926 RepID=A0ABT1CJH5_9PROT|nr:GNAT family N-acetyltransferase [Asaia lannensis]MCO6161021.1 GNAT family N-acetyltransferase [Asaia lannensis NBRC 102526]GBQ95518.1 acetyltransferase [Asaia lannensis NBRC 102526]